MNSSRKRLLIFFIFLTFFVMAAIFFFSSQNAASSSKTSGSVVRFILSILVRGFKDMSAKEQRALIVKWASLIRKAAHFTEFAALGFSFTTSLILRRSERLYLKSTAFGVLYAVFDEVHQLFSVGRACSVFDVMIDTSGYITGLIVSVLILYIFRRRKV